MDPSWAPWGLESSGAVASGCRLPVPYLICSRHWLSPLSRDSATRLLTRISTFLTRYPESFGCARSWLSQFFWLAKLNLPVSWAKVLIYRDIRQCRRRYCAFGLAKMSLFFKLWQEPFQSRPHWRLPQTSFRAKEWRAGVFDGKQWEQKANRQNIAGYWFLVCHSPIFTMLPSEGFSTLEFHK